MKCIDKFLRSPMGVSALFLVLFLLVDKSLSQNLPPVVGVPLPILKGGQGLFEGSFSPVITPINSAKTKDLSKNTYNIVGSKSSKKKLSGLGSGSGILQAVDNPSKDKEIVKLLDHPEVLRKIQKETRADSATKIDSVISAHKQVVAGLITYLDVRVVETICALGTADPRLCDVDPKEDEFICEIAVWERPWLNVTKVIDEKSKCAEIEDDIDFKNWNRQSSHFFSVPVNSIAVHLKQIPAHLDEMQVAKEAFDYTRRGSESKFKGEMIDYKIGDVRINPDNNVTRIQVSVTYGFTFCLQFPNLKVDTRVCPIDRSRDTYVCSLTVISGSNLNTKLQVAPEKDDDIDCQRRHPVDEELIIPVQAKCLGCPKTVSLNDPSVLGIANYAVTEFDRSSDDKELHMMVRLIKAQTQVVDGINYFLTIEIAETTCLKALSAINMNRTLCQRKLYDETDICEMQILEQPWQNTKELIYFRCFDKHEYPKSTQDEFIVPGFGGGFTATNLGSSVGGTSRTSSNPNTRSLVPSIASLSEEMKSTLEYLVDEINRRENIDDADDGYYKVLQVHKADVVDNLRDGTLQHIILELGETICKWREASNNCPLKPGEDKEICEARVLIDGIGGKSINYLYCNDVDELPRGSPYSSFHPRDSNTPLSTFLHQPFSDSSSGFVSGHSGHSGHSGLIPAAKNSSHIVTVANFVVSQFNLQSEEDEVFKLGSVINAHTETAGVTKYLLEVELLETRCKKYQPVTDLSKCAVERREDPEICQAEVLQNGADLSELRMTRIYCDDKEDFYIKMISRTHGGSGSSSAHGTGGAPAWRPADSASDKAKALGRLMAEEFDSRSDEDNIFVLSKVLEIKSESLNHFLRVELAETVCPKYKRGINKTRCQIDIGEDYKICEGKISERPWRNDQEVLELSCMERDDSHEGGHQSKEILYPRVHPTAHARPRFLESRFKIRTHHHHDGSKESFESNEQYYNGGQNRHHDVDSDEAFERNDRDDDDDDDDAPRRRYSRQYNGDRHRGRQSDDNDSYSDDDNDNDNDSRSKERFSKKRRQRRQLGGERSIPGGWSSSNDHDAGIEMANFALSEKDLLNDAISGWRKTLKIVNLQTQVVAGINWKIKAEVIETKCPKTPEAKLTLATCDAADGKVKTTCDIVVYEVPWLKTRSVTEFNCSP